MHARARKGINTVTLFGEGRKKRRRERRGRNLRRAVKNYFDERVSRILSNCWERRAKNPLRFNCSLLPLVVIIPSQNLHFLLSNPTTRNGTHPKVVMAMSVTGQVSPAPTHHVYPVTDVDVGWPTLSTPHFVVPLGHVPPNRGCNGYD